jgi:two-component system chemotaxis sensor kinase CheA
MSPQDAALMKSLTSELEQLAEAVVFAEPSDLPALAQLHTRFQELAQSIIGSGRHPKSVGAVNAAADIIEKIVLGDVPNVVVAWKSVGQTIAALLTVFRDGRPEDETQFPFGSGVTLTLEIQTQGGFEQTTKPEQTQRAFRLSPQADEAIFAEFLSRQTSVLQDMEASILAMEKIAGKEVPSELKRILHTLKGEAALLGLTEVEHLCHTTEDILSREGSGRAADFLFEVKDWLSRSFAYYAGKDSAPESVAQLLSKLEKEQDGKGDISHTSIGTATDEKNAESDVIIIEADPDLLKDFVAESEEHLHNADVSLLKLETDAQNEDAINAVFRAFHTIKGVSGFLDLKEVGSLAHESENLLDKARKHDLVLAGPTMDVVFDATDSLKKMIAGLREYLATSQNPKRDPTMPLLLDRIRRAARGEQPASAALPMVPNKKLGEILVAAGSVTAENLEAALAKQSADPGTMPLGEQLVQDGAVSAKDVAQALRAQKNSTRVVEVKESVKVDADRLDRLVDAVGELVIAEAMVSQSIQHAANQEAGLLRHLNQLDRITRELQEMATSLRMVPVRATFQKMARLARDLSRKSGKKLDFITVGEDTELDKTVVDRIGDPLVHLVRNAVDHGLEKDETARLAAGKPESGRVELRAYHKGGNIYIEIEDDGRGLNREAILKKAREKHLLRPDETPPDRDIWNLIFEPGFSTAEKVTDVSGRGVGMDVVRKNIEALRGSIDIRTKLGKGSVFSLRLPLTLAIIDGLVVQVAGERYILPTLSVVCSIRPKAEDLTTVVGKGEMLKLHGRLLPLFRLERMFSTKDAQSDPTQAAAVVVEAEGRRVAVLVDTLLDRRQIVIKSLGEALQNLPGIAGGAVMPDGRVGLIVDVAGLVKLANE